MSEEIARGMVCFFHQKKHSYLIFDKKWVGLLFWATFSQTHLVILPWSHEI
jgi:hypothetical protein